MLALASTSIATAILNGCSDKSFTFKKNQRIGCIGDSVTYSGGNGYVELLQKHVDQKYPEYNLKFINLGLNSETITGLTENNHPGPRPFLFDRLERILDESNLDIAFFCYGINCGIYNPPSQSIFDAYKNGVLKYLEIVKARDLKVILLTPPPLVLTINNNQESKIINANVYSWKNPYPKYDIEVIQEFKKIILEKNHPSVITKIDIHTPLLQNADKSYGKDPIHPNYWGHKIIANTIKDHITPFIV